MNTQTKNRRGRSGLSTSRRRTFSSSHTASKPRHGTFKGNRPQKRDNTNRGGKPAYRTGRQRSGARKMPTFDPTRFINTNPTDAIEEMYTPKHRFHTFGLSHKLVHAITSLGIKIPSPIQDKIIPEILAGRDVIGIAETGTGKTAAFLIPLIEKTLKEYSRQTLVLTPTRELAIQIENELKQLSKNSMLFSVTCVGGTGIHPQIKALRRKNHFIIGTPGRILDLIKRKNFDPAKVTTVVLDEADRMLDMGFIHDMRTILSSTPKDRETLFFSATMSGDIQQITRDFLNNPVTVSVKKKDVTNSIEQDVVPFEHHTKFETLLTVLKKPECTRVLIFGSMKHSVEKLAKQLSAGGVLSESIHGNKSHGQRQRALAKFKSGYARVLVATDVAARGIHVDNVSHVINYDLPNTFEDYVHRIGRTGRADKRGKALTFVPAQSKPRSHR